MDSVKAVEKILKYKFKNKSLLTEALTHDSCKESFSNERIEFLGDAVIEIAITKHIYLTYPTSAPDLLTKVRTANVCNWRLARIGLKHGLYQFLRHKLGKLDGDIKDFSEAVSKEDETVPLHPYGGFLGILQKTTKIIADLVEAIAGAVYIDVKFDVQRFWLIFRDLLEPLVTLDEIQRYPDALSRLRKLCEKPHKKVEIRKLTEGFNETAQIYLDGELFASGHGKQAAALEALRKLGCVDMVVDENTPPEAEPEDAKGKSSSEICSEKMLQLQTGESSLITVSEMTPKQMVIGEDNPPEVEPKTSQTPNPLTITFEMKQKNTVTGEEDSLKVTPKNAKWKLVMICSTKRWPFTYSVEKVELDKFVSTIKIEIASAEGSFYVKGDYKKRKKLAEQSAAYHMLKALKSPFMAHVVGDTESIITASKMTPKQMVIDENPLEIAPEYSKRKFPEICTEKMLQPHTEASFFFTVSEMTPEHMVVDEDSPPVVEPKDAKWELFEFHATKTFLIQENPLTVTYEIKQEKLVTDEEASLKVKPKYPKKKLNNICSKKRWPFATYSLERAKGSKEFVSIVKIVIPNAKASFYMKGDYEVERKHAESSAAYHMIKALKSPFMAHVVGDTKSIITASKMTPKQMVIDENPLEIAPEYSKRKFSEICTEKMLQPHTEKKQFAAKEAIWKLSECVENNENTPPEAEPEDVKGKLSEICTEKMLQLQTGSSPLIAASEMTPTQMVIGENSPLEIAPEDSKRKFSEICTEKKQFPAKEAIRKSECVDMVVDANTPPEAEPEDVKRKLSEICTKKMLQLQSGSSRLIAASEMTPKQMVIDENSSLEIAAEDSKRKFSEICTEKMLQPHTGASFFITVSEMTPKHMVTDEDGPPEVVPKDAKWELFEFHATKTFQIQENPLIVTYEMKQEKMVTGEEDSLKVTPENAKMKLNLICSSKRWPCATYSSERVKGLEKFVSTVKIEIPTAKSLFYMVGDYKVKRKHAESSAAYHMLKALKSPFMAHVIGDMESMITASEMTPKQMVIDENSPLEVALEDSKRKLSECVDENTPPEAEPEDAKGKLSEICTEKMLQLQTGSSPLIAASEMTPKQMVIDENSPLEIAAEDSKRKFSEICTEKMLQPHTGASFFITVSEMTPKHMVTDEDGPPEVVPKDAKWELFEFHATKTFQIQENPLIVTYEMKQEKMVTGEEDSLKVTPENAKMKLNLICSSKRWPCTTYSSERVKGLEKFVSTVKIEIPTAKSLFYMVGDYKVKRKHAESSAAYHMLKALKSPFMAHVIGDMESMITASEMTPKQMVIDENSPLEVALEDSKRKLSECVDENTPPEAEPEDAKGKLSEICTEKMLQLQTGSSPLIAASEMTPKQMVIDENSPLEIAAEDSKRKFSEICTEKMLQPHTGASFFITVSEMTPKHMVTDEDGPPEVVPKDAKWELFEFHATKTFQIQKNPLIVTYEMKQEKMVTGEEDSLKVTLKNAKMKLNLICSSKRWPCATYSSENVKGSEKFVSTVKIDIPNAKCSFYTKGDYKGKKKHAESSAAYHMIRALKSSFMAHVVGDTESMMSFAKKRKPILQQISEDEDDWRISGGLRRSKRIKMM